MIQNEISALQLLIFKPNKIGKKIEVQILPVQVVYYGIEV